MRNISTLSPYVVLIVLLVSPPALAENVCGAQSAKGDICLCKLSDLHPTQASVGMTEVQTKAEKLKDEIEEQEPPWVHREDFMRLRSVELDGAE
jgi:hypothetical protein